MKRKIQLFVSVVLMTALLLSLAACGNSGVKGDLASNGSKSDSTVSESALAEPVEIEYWYGLGGNLGKLMEEIITKYNESQKEVIVKGVQQGDYGETMKAIQAGTAAQKLPACAMLTWQNVRKLSESNLLEELDSYIEKDGNFNAKDIIPAYIDVCRLKDKTYALPVYGTTQVLYYRKDSFQKAGIDPNVALKTWENLAEAAGKLAVKNGKETVFYGWEPMSGASNMIDAAWSRGAEILSSDERQVTITTAEWIDTWESFRKWINEDKIMGIHYGGQGWEYWYATIDDVMQNRAAGYTGSSGDQGDLDFNVVAAHIQPGWEGHDPSPFTDAVISLIPKNAPEDQKEAAFKWLSYLSSTETTAYFSIKSGYIAVRNSAMESPQFKEYAQDHPQIMVPIQQASIARPQFYDPTGGKIYEALDDAAEKLQIENVSAKTALEEAQKIAQKALDEYLAKSGK